MITRIHRLSIILIFMLDRDVPAYDDDIFIYLFIDLLLTHLSRSVAVSCGLHV